MFSNSFNLRIFTLIPCKECSKAKINHNQYAKLNPTNIQYNIDVFGTIAIDLQDPLPVNLDKLGVKAPLLIVQIKNRKYVVVFIKYFVKNICLFLFHMSHICLNTLCFFLGHIVYEPGSVNVS